MEQEINQIIYNNNTIQDQVASNKVELALQKLNNITIPSIILEYTAPDNLDFELDDLKQFYNHFGEVLNIVIKGKQNIVLFKTFFSANICKVFLENKEYYRNNSNNNFVVRWFDINKDGHILPPESKELFQQINERNIKQNLLNNKMLNSINNNIGINMNLNMEMNNMNNISNINSNVNINQNIMDITNPNLSYLKNNNIFPGVNNFPQPGIGAMSNFNGLNQIQNPSIPINMLINQNIPNINNQNNFNNGIGGMTNINNLNNINNFNMNGINNLNSPNGINGINNLNINNINNININDLSNINNINNILINPNNNVLNNNILNTNILPNNQYIQNNHNPNKNHNNNHNSNHNNNHNNNNHNTGEEKNPGKYTCKYEILIENNSEFQIARRLIGSKGYNMKKIINECKNGDDREGVKLRLRGKGSGYKEGPENKESDEPLHLCISSKNTETMEKACLLVEKLLERIHQEYKEYCEKNNILPASTEIATRIENKNTFYKSK